MTHAIEIDNVSKRFGRKIALQNVSLAVPEGSVFALLGENGAGKSTLIRAMLGYHRFDSGTIRVLGLDPLRRSTELRRSVGYVSDAPAFYEWMTIEQIGAFAAGFYPLGFMEQYAKIAESYQLPWSTRIRDLSKGMRSKVALALATASKPRLLVLDEPTSGLDPLVRRQFLESMVERAAEGQTVLLSSHQIHEVERVADWIAILHRGIVQVCQPLETLKQSMLNVSFSMHDPLQPLPTVLHSCQIVDMRQDERSRQVMLRNPDPAVIEQLRNSDDVFDFHTLRPSLEELYIALTRDSTASSVGDSSVPPPTDEVGKISRNAG
ncbi:MAG: ABC transporter ATP-binding protein [Pirellulaceae bacterium]|nr:ABC transporter ATP-binding protein [Pirellulaceae bacterium]